MVKFKTKYIGTEYKDNIQTQKSNYKLIDDITNEDFDLIDEIFGEDDGEELYRAGIYYQLESISPYNTYLHSIDVDEISEYIQNKIEEYIADEDEDYKLEKSKYLLEKLNKHHGWKIYNKWIPKILSISAKKGEQIKVELKGEKNE